MLSDPFAGKENQQINEGVWGSQPVTYPSPMGTLLFVLRILPSSSSAVLTLNMALIHSTAHGATLQAWSLRFFGVISCLGKKQLCRGVVLSKVVSSLCPVGSLGLHPRSHDLLFVGQGSPGKRMGTDSPPLATLAPHHKTCCTPDQCFVTVSKISVGSNLQGRQVNLGLWFQRVSQCLLVSADLGSWERKVSQRGPSCSNP